MFSYFDLIPPNEQSRLAALKPYRVLGSLPDPVLDELVRLTAKLFDRPIALLSLVEDTHVRFQANYGLAGLRRVAQEESLCSVAILQDETSVYVDLLAEPCQQVTPLLVEQLHMRSYIGHPLQTPEQVNIGTLCVIGPEAWVVSVAECQRLQALAGLAVDLLRLRLARSQAANPPTDPWRSIYTDLDRSLTRLDTLKTRAEPPPAGTDSPAPSAYQQALGEKAAVVIDLLKKKVQALLTQYEPPRCR